MPHLQLEMNFSAMAEAKKKFAAAVIRHFSEIMDTGTDHIAVTRGGTAASPTFPLS